MLLIGGRWWLAFDGIAADWAVQPMSALGVNNLIADMGGLFLGGSIMILLGLRSGQSVWLLAAALLNAIAASGRLLGFAAFEVVPEALISVSLEILASVLLIYTHKRMTAEESNS